MVFGVDKNDKKETEGRVTEERSNNQVDGNRGKEEDNTGE